MNFEKVLESLYSSDDALICDTLNEGLHVSQCVEADDAVSTGFQCKTHKGTIFNVWYLISQQKVCYVKSLSPKRQIIGVSCKYNPNLRSKNNYNYYNTGFYRPQKDHHTWYDSYDIESTLFNQVIIKEINKDDNKNTISLTTESYINRSSFLILKNHIEILAYPIFSTYIPVLFKSDAFSPRSYMKDKPSYERIDTTWNNYGVSCEIYNGYNGWSDDLIDDVFGGIPEATWNVD